MKSRKLWAGVAMTTLALVGALFASLGAIAHAATTSVAVRDNSYDAASITIAVGDTVMWDFSDPATMNLHSVTSTGAETFDSGVLSPGDPSFSHTFTTAGSFGYLCVIHGSSMSGTVNVQAPNTATATASSTADDPTATRTARATSTGTAGATNTPAPGATATPIAAVPISAPVQNAPAPPAGGAAPATTASLPRTGFGGNDGGQLIPWFAAALAISGAVSTGAAIAVQRTRR